MILGGLQSELNASLMFCLLLFFGLFFVFLFCVVFVVLLCFMFLLFVSVFLFCVVFVERCGTPCLLHVWLPFAFCVQEFRAKLARDGWANYEKIIVKRIKTNI